jgi:hypothetical protein
MGTTRLASDSLLGKQRTGAKRGSRRKQADDQK